MEIIMYVWSYSIRTELGLTEVIIHHGSM